MQARMIRLVPPCRPQDVSTPYYHDVDFQMQLRNCPPGSIGRYATLAIWRETFPVPPSWQWL